MGESGQTMINFFKKPEIIFILILIILTVFIFVCTQIENHKKKNIVQINNLIKYNDNISYYHSSNNWNKSEKEDFSKYINNNIIIPLEKDGTTDGYWIIKK